MVYLALLRGINVGGNNKVPMSELKACFEGLGFENVKTYIASGNVIFESDLDAKQAAAEIEAILPTKFRLNRKILRVLVISRDHLEQIVRHAPPGFGAKPDKYHSDALFVIDVSPEDVMKAIELHPEVDKAWPGNGVVYFQRVSLLRTKSRLGKVISKPIYQNMTIRSWNTTTKLLDLMDQIES